MPDISKMSSKQKSVLLAKVRGWKVRHTRPGGPPYWGMYDGEKLIGREFKGLGYPNDDIMYTTLTPDLYDPSNMSLAKSTILWGYNFIPQFHQWLHKPGTALAILIGGPGFSHALDQMLKMAIENGLIEMKKEGGQ